MLDYQQGKPGSGGRMQYPDAAAFAFCNFPQFPCCGWDLRFGDGMVPLRRPRALQTQQETMETKRAQTTRHLNKDGKTEGSIFKALLRTTQ
jgi:hypothetical protein